MPGHYVRPFPRRHAMWGQHVTHEPSRHPSPRTGGAVSLPAFSGPATPVAIGNMSFNGMDPSDPTTWVIPYNPQPGMIGYLNFDGARVNTTQTVAGRKNPRRRKALRALKRIQTPRGGGVAGSSRDNG